MLQWLWLIPVFPLAGFAVLALAGRSLPRTAIAMIGVGTVGLSTLAAIGVAQAHRLPAPRSCLPRDALDWIDVGPFVPTVTLYLDALSLVMVLVVVFVSLLIHLYSSEFMWDEEGYSRFFAYMNLFVASMLTVVKRVVEHDLCPSLELRASHALAQCQSAVLHFQDDFALQDNIPPQVGQAKATDACHARKIGIRRLTTLTRLRGERMIFL